jgi:hypothetical protein
VEVSRLVGTTIAILLRLDLVGLEVPIIHQVSKIISIFSILIDTSRWARADAISFSSLRRKYSRHHSLRQHCDCESFQWRRQHFRAEHRRYVGQSERYLALVFQEYLGFLYAYCFINFLQWQCLPVVTHSMARGYGQGSHTAPCTKSHTTCQSSTIVIIFACHVFSSSGPQSTNII